MSDKVALMFQHADDTTMTISDTGSITEVFELYRNASGAKLITQKSEIMCIGSGCLKDIKVENAFDISETNIMEILGIFLVETRKNVKF